VRENPHRDIKNTRRIHSAEFKVRVALEAVCRKSRTRIPD
jgi:hypothetical protein